MTTNTRKKELMDNLLKQEITETVLKMIQYGENVTMEETAKKCGVAKGTLYNYFKNREDLLNHVHKSVVTPIIESNAGIFMGDGDPIERLHKFVTIVYDIHDSVCSYFRFMQTIKTVADEIQEKFVMVIEPLSRLMQDGIDKGVFIKNDPYIMSDMVYGTVIGPLKSMFYRNMECVNMEEMKADVIALIDRIIIDKEGNR